MLDNPPSVHSRYVTHIFTIKYFLPICTLDMSHILTLRYFVPPLYVVDVSHILTLRYFSPPLYVMDVSHILILTYFLPSTLCSVCATYTHTQVFSPLHLCVVDVSHILILRYFLPSTLRSGCVLFITINQVLNSASLRETIQIDSFIQSEHTTHSGADPAPCQFYNCFLTVIKETIFSSVICEDYCFGLLLSACLSEDLVWIIF